MNICSKMANWTINGSAQPLKAPINDKQNSTIPTRQTNPLAQMQIFGCLPRPKTMPSFASKAGLQKYAGILVNM
jgi:hypothetical protein